MKKKMMTAVIMALVCCALLAAGCGSAAGGSGTGQVSDEKNNPQADAAASAGGEASIAPADLHHVEIKVKDYGTITLVLDAGAAPKTVENFMKLAEEGFYDGLTFHRIMDGFMIQGGDPLGNGTGGSDATIEGEFASNGFDNPISHGKGVISMARAQDPDSASSQFFIVQSDSTFLDGQYAGFGYVTDGMEIVDQICKDAKPTDNNGSIAKDSQPKIESVTVIE
jgi:peptidyl-prolyl cis-trans isomerase B (cyclophilin B)